MNIGILTFHSQINYGGVLQAYALQKVLQDNGYDVEVIDFWLTPENTHLLGEWLDGHISIPKRVIRFCMQTVLVGYVRDEIVRRKRTIQFLEQHLKRSKCVYRNQSELAAVNGYDVIIVGSDQVWNYRSPRIPNPFLLGFLTENQRRISYAASFGFKELPSERFNEYRQALLGFQSISVREKEGQDIVRDICNRSSEWVLDPTLLLEKEKWMGLFPNRGSSDAYVFCYWLGDINRIVPLLVKLAKTRGQVVHLYADWRGWGLRQVFVQLMLRGVFMFSPRIKCCFSAGPVEFVEGIASSSAVISDSFHAMMFARIFEKPMQIIINSTPSRKKMAARMKEFAARYNMSGVVIDDIPDELDISSVEKPYVSEKMDEDRLRSLQFLCDAVAF
ncbi:MAG: polysaccharide pyruvyl transferase family protein [Kiritimatiellae bacterium]|jgi:hypothetical protein|nr:polysaccharide pyruvyl transferase family protein [Kiritimatiellia bacterium]